MSDVLKALSWRYATHKFDMTKKLSSEELSGLLEAARLAPSSFGLQPWKFVVVQNPELRKRLSAAAFNQPQVLEASDIIVLCSKTTLDETYVDRYAQLIAQTRNIPVEGLSGMKKMILGTVGSRTEQEIIDWNKRQTYIALGTLLMTAALQHIDASPMEGFNPVQVDEILGLPAKGFTAAVLCAVGHRSPEDPGATNAKVRFPANEVIVIV